MRAAALTLAGWMTLAVSGVASGQAGSSAGFPMSAPVPSAFGGILPGSYFAVADFNEDGADDVVSVTSGIRKTLLTVPGGGYGPPNVAPYLPGSTSLVQLAHDVTGDGHADILARFFSYSVAETTVLFPGDGAGSFGIPVQVPDPSGFLGSYHRCFAADGLSGPGSPVFLFCVSTSVPSITNVYLAQAGSGPVSLSLLRSVAAPAGITGFGFTAAGDVDGDGLVDLVGYASATSWVTHVGYLRGIPAAPWFATQVSVVPLPSNVLFSGRFFDVDNDGTLDAVGAAGGAVGTPWGTATIDFAVLLGGPAPFTNAVVSPSGTESPYTAFGDFDGDGIGDWIGATLPPPWGTMASAVFYRGDGQGSFRPALTVPGILQSWDIFPVAADADGDGATDAVFPSTATVFYNQSRIGPGLAGTGGLVPQTTAGLATLGNPFYFVGVNGAAPNATAILGVSLGILSSPAPTGVLLDPSTLILPTGSFGAFPTNGLGEAVWVLSLPPNPPAIPQTVYLQWGVLDPTAPAGYALTPARKVVFW